MIVPWSFFVFLLADPLQERTCIFYVQEVGTGGLTKPDSGRHEGDCGKSLTRRVSA